MNKSFKLQRLASFVFLLSLFASTETVAGINSVLIDRESASSKIIVLGVGLAGASFRLAGVVIPFTCIDNISDTEQHIGFCTEAASAIPNPGSYNLLINGVDVFSIYAERAIIAPPPPPLSSECPCTSGWLAADVPKDNSAWCSWGVDGTQEWITTTQIWLDGIERADVLSAAFDPNNIFFDSGNVGNSLSFCAHYDGSDYTVAEPVVSWEQYDDCVEKLFQNICF